MFKTKAVIFDMYETLVTHYRSPQYFGAQMAADAGIPAEDFLLLWHASAEDRTLGRRTLETVLEEILRTYGCFSPELMDQLILRRISAKKECFRHLHEGILPLLQALRDGGCRIGLISNCFSEEAVIIRESTLFGWFDEVFLSCEQKLQKPDPEIFLRCTEALKVPPRECIYVGDGGSRELETAASLGMVSLQAGWYLSEAGVLDSRRKESFPLLKDPFEILLYAKNNPVK